MFKGLFILFFFCQILTVLRGEWTNGVVSEPPEVSRLLSKILTPGHWTSWSFWICDAVCGKGRYFRKRVCVSTEEFGIPTCHGQSVERSQNTCKVPCPGIKQLKEKFFGPSLPKSLKKILLETLTSGNDAYERKVGDTIQFDCYNIVTVEFLVNYSTSSIYWEKNDNRMRFEPNRMIVSDYSILGINDLSLSDTGVYTCNVRLSKSFKKTILVFSLVVLGDPYQLHVSSSDEVEVTCNSRSIGRLFFPSGLQMRWIAANRVIKDYPPSIPPQNVNDDTITHVKEGDTGLWACVIRDDVYNRTWITNAFFVKVHQSLVLTAWRSLHPIAKVALVLGAVLIMASIGGVVAFYAIQIYKRHQERILKEELRLILKTTQIMKQEDEN